MVFLKTLLVILEALTSLLLIGLILLQRSKGEGLGLAFGAGVGESLFGARAGNVLSRMTVILGIFFMANTLVLGVLFAQHETTLMDQAAPVAAQPAVQAQPVDALDLIDQAPVAAEPVAGDDAAKAAAE